MKKIIPVLGALALCAACQTPIITPVDYYVTLDKATTFKAGKPVYFKLNGEADYYMFYSGEPGHEYRYRERTQVDLENVKSATLTLTTTPERYGGKGNVVDFYLSKTFGGLTGEEETDRALMEAEVANGMAQWEKLDWTEGENLLTKVDEYDISDYLSHFCLAIHYNPSSKNPETKLPQHQTTFNISGLLTMDIENIPLREFPFPNLQRYFVSLSRDADGTPYPFMLNSGNYYTYNYYMDHANTNSGSGNLMDVSGLSDEEKSKLYHVQQGGVAFGWSQGDIRFCGSSVNVHSFDVDLWLVYSPVQLNTVEKDRGSVVKNLENDLYEFAYTYDEPGYYKAVFHGFNVTSDQRYDQVVEIPVIITD